MSLSLEALLAAIRAADDETRRRVMAEILKVSSEDEPQPRSPSAFPLLLTSPHTTGDRVREAQKLLAKNPYGDFEPGEADGEYGPLTAQATYRAEYWLGFRKPNQAYGEYLDALLSGKRKLSPAMEARRKSRLKKREQTPKRELAWAEAEKWVGLTEIPAGSNKTPFGVWYGWNGVAWCAIFVSFCYVKGAKSKAFDPKQGHYAYCPYVANDALAGRNHLSVTKNPKRGDIVLFDWNNDGVADHIGLFGEWTNRAKGEFTTIEGNTSISDNSNGGQVMRRTRTMADAHMFVHVSE